VANNKATMMAAFGVLCMDNTCTCKALEPISSWPV
jgi:hypothetical protein